MFYILTHIFFFRSLRILHRNEPALLLNRLSHLAAQKGLKNLAQRDGYLLLSLDEKRDRAESVLFDTVAQLEENIAVTTDWMNGYSILIERLDWKESEEAFQTLRKAAFLVSKENKAWICPNLLKEKSISWNLPPSTVPIVLKPGHIPLQNDDDETLKERIAHSPLFRVLTSAWTIAKKDKGPLCFVHPDPSGLWIHLRHLLPDTWRVDVFEKPLPLQDPLVHFTACLDTDIDHPFPLGEDYMGDDWETAVVEACSTWLENPANKRSRRVFVFFYFSEWPPIFLKFWEKVLRASVKWVKPVFWKSRNLLKSVLVVLSFWRTRKPTSFSVWKG